MPLASEIALPDRYRVTQHIANGGMASVWQAEDQLLGRVVAVKVLAQHYAADAGARARFQREARTAAQVSDHPNVVTIYDIGEHADRAFIVMEHFAGGSVSDRLRGGAAIPRDTALRWLRETAAGLDVAHAAGIVHRDVKPGNLLLDTHDRLAVGDFGIARLADDTSMTQTGQVLGTAAYLSPEQAMGRPATAASDRYALAVVAYELLTGRRPFTAGGAAAQARQHMEDEPPAAAAAAGLPAAVDAVLRRAMAKDPAARPASATAFVDELERAAGGTVPTAAAAPVTEPTRRVGPVRAAAPRRRLAPWLALAVAALLIGGIVAALAGGGGGEGAQDTAGGGQAQETTPEPEPEPQAEAPAEQPAPAPAPAASPSELDAQGFALIQQERYEEAVPILQQAVQGFRDAGDTRSQGYAFALFNLGTALNRSGRPAEAIPYFDERLSFSDDRRDVVEAERADAQAKLDEGGDGDGRGNGRGKRGRGNDDD